MVTQESISGNWHRIVGAVKEKFGQITGDDLTKVEGNLDQLVGLIQRKSGETRANVEKFLNECSNSADSTYRNVSEAASQYASQAGTAVQEGVDEIKHQASEGYEYAKGAVHNRPLESLTVVAGISVLAGLALGLSLASRR